LTPPPKYSNLKGGHKPTYRELYNISVNKNKKIHLLEPISTTFSPREKILNKIKNRVIKTRKKYTLGKNKKSNNITVLVKDNKTRKKINNELNKLKCKSIYEIKTYLKNNNIIKTGSLAPNDVLRKMYEEMHLAGNVKNNSENVLIHNYISNDDED